MSATIRSRSWPGTKTLSFFLLRPLPLLGGFTAVALFRLSLLPPTGGYQVLSHLSLILAMQGAGAYPC